MSRSERVQAWLEQLDMRGAGTLAPQHCRDNLLKADALVAPLSPHGLHFAEFPLLGEHCFDMTWGVSVADVLECSDMPYGLEWVKPLAKDMSSSSMFLFEYDASELQMPAPAFYFKGKLANGNHAIYRMLECAGRVDEARGALLVVAKLVKLGYASKMCGIMTGREHSPVRITAKPTGEFNAARLMMDLVVLGFGHFSSDAFGQLDQVCMSNEYMASAPILYLDVMPDGTLGPTLGIELNGIRAGNAGEYPQLRLAQEWGLADDRWKVLRDASFGEIGTHCFAPNTIKFRWSDNEPLPAKLYMKAGW